MSESEPLNPFKAARVAAKLTQTQVASKLGVRPATVVAWEQGTQPQADTLERIAELYGVDAESLRSVDQRVLADVPRPSPGDTITIPRDLAFEWRGQIIAELRHMEGMRRTFEALLGMLGDSTGTIRGFVDSGVLPRPGSGVEVYPTSEAGVAAAARAAAAERDQGESA